MWTLIGVTGYDLPTIAALTFPQLSWLLQGQGPILLPRLRPQIDANWANVDDEGVQKILKEHAGTAAEPTKKDRDRAAAYKIQNAFYLGLQATPSPVAQAQPIAGLPPETARAIVAFAEADGFPMDVWADDVAPLWHQIQATAKQGQG